MLDSSKELQSEIEASLNCNASTDGLGARSCGEYFDARSVPESQRFELWNAAGPFRVRPLPTVGDAIVSRLRQWRLGMVTLSCAFNHAHIATTTGDKRQDSIRICKVMSDEYRVWSGFDSIVAEMGDIIVYDLAERSIIKSRNTWSLEVEIPKDCLKDTTFENNLVCVLPVASLANRLLTVAMEQWRREAAEGIAAESALIEETIISLARVVLANKPHTEEQTLQLRDLRRLAIKRAIDHRILQGEVDPEALCTEFAVSRATLYRYCEEFGGISTYSRKKRLEHSLIRLTSAAPGRGIIKQVSGELGFVDPLAFSRSFSREFGFSPSDALGLAYRSRSVLSERKNRPS